MRNGTDRQSLDISAKRASCTRVPHYPDRDARTSDATSEAVDSVGTLDLKVIEAFFWHSSCSDQGEAPFRGAERYGRPSPPAIAVARSGPFLPRSSKALLRQYLHKTADLATFTQDELNAVAAKLNHRPRRVLGWATPAQALGTVEPKPTLLALG